MKWRCVILLLLLSLKAGAEIRWNGQSGNGLWADAGNWENGLLPGPDDDVLLDNSLLPFTYKVVLPDFAVSVKSIRLLPAPFGNIILELPVSNLIASPSGSQLDRGFTTNGKGYSLLIGKGAVLLNASGSSSGYSIRISDSLQIKNGGTYIHRTRTGHAEIVQQLSIVNGTETGIFRFENTDAASIVSLSGRIYGSLQLSADASPTHLTSYSASGTNPVLVRGNLELGTGVSLSVNFDDTISINADLRMQDAVFNLASGNRSSTVLINGNWVQQGGLIKETNIQQNTGTLLLAGSTLQQINCTGSISDSVILVVKNPAGVKLEHSLRLPYRLKLEKGVLATSDIQLLIMAPEAGIIADSTVSSNYIDGPIKKEGLTGSYFLFPTGEAGFQRWIGLKNATGDFTIDYHREPAYNHGSMLEPGLDHISQLEYWSVHCSQSANAQVELSFDNKLSGGVSDLMSLRVAAFKQGIWRNEGNTGTTGAANDKGSVMSNLILETAAALNYFTLASSSGFTNVLPIRFEQLWMESFDARWFCNWRVSGTGEDDSFELELSPDGIHYVTAARLQTSLSGQYYREKIPAKWEKGYCRINSVSKNGEVSRSPVMRFGKLSADHSAIDVSKPAGSNWIQISSGKTIPVIIELFDNKGSLIERGAVTIPIGNYIYRFANGRLPGGIYTLRISASQELLLVEQLIF